MTDIMGWDEFPCVKKEDFTFKVINGETPSITINGKKIAIVTCVYDWATASDKSIGMSIVMVAGYIVGEFDLRVFQLDLKTKKVTELEYEGVM